MSLMELYQTQKGKIRNAAVESLVRLNAVGIQPYLEKICAKEKPTAAEEALIRLSGAPVCVQYALNKVQKYAENIVMDKYLYLMIYLENMTDLNLNLRVSIQALKTFLKMFQKHILKMLRKVYFLKTKKVLQWIVRS